jgi:hypothetical protein
LALRSKRESKALAGFLGFTGVGIVRYWVRWLRQGNLKEGVRTVEGDSYVALHVAAEVLAGVVSIVAAVGLVTGRTWATVAAAFALGMVAYSTVNALGSALRGDRKLVVPLLGALGGSLRGAATLLRSRSEAEE